MILVDINIFMDVFEGRRGWTSSLEVINRVRTGKTNGFISALTIPILWFLRAKYYAEEQAKKDVIEIIKGFEIVDLSQEIIERAFKSPIKDFEDTIQFYTAKQTQCGRIITRNVADFPKSGILIITPEEYLMGEEE